MMRFLIGHIIQHTTLKPIMDLWRFIMENSKSSTMFLWQVQLIQNKNLLLYNLEEDQDVVVWLGLFQVFVVSCTKYPNSVSCQRALEREKIVQLIFLCYTIRKDLNPYNVYGYCYGNSSIYHTMNLYKFSEFYQILCFKITCINYNEQLNQSKNYVDYQNPSSTSYQLDVEDYSCIDYGILNNYFNNQEVKQKLKIQEDRKWESYNIDIFLNYKRDKRSHTLMKLLFDNNIRILQYSGNAEDIISFDYTYASFKLIDGLVQIQEKVNQFQMYEESHLQINRHNKWQTGQLNIIIQHLYYKRCRQYGSI